MVGWDGAEPALVEPWVRQGKLPVLGSLVQRGALGRVRSTKPPVTPPAWTSLMTGVDPGRHGIYSFIRPDESYRAQVVTASERRFPSVWQYLSAAGRRVGVFNLSLTYPPEPVNGFLFAGFDAPVFGPALAHPAEAFRVATRGLSGYVHEGVDRLRDMAEAREVSREMRQQRDMLFRLMQKWPVEVLAVNYNGPDRIHHHGWPLGWTAEQLAASSGSAVERTYRDVDDLLGDLLAEYADEQTEIILVSDHGGGRLLGQVTLGNALAEAGFLVRRPRPPAAPLTSALKTVRRWMPPGMRAHVQRVVGAKVRLAVGDRMREGLGADVDWSRSVAFPWGSGGFVQVNLRGREAQGCVAPGDREKVLSDVEACLRDLRDPVTGQPAMGDLLRSETVYPAAPAGRAPDLLAVGAGDEYGVASWWLGDGDAGGSVTHFGRWRDCPRSVTGTHRPWGVLATCGPSVKPGAVVPEMRLEDVAPALLYLAGVPIPEGLDGQLQRSLWDTGDEPQTQGQTPAVLPPEPASPYTGEEEAAVKRRLEDLGYM
jgi:predicted AlkP superfamily phosphohydrolase/phosphomutase